MLLFRKRVYIFKIYRLLMFGCGLSQLAIYLSKTCVCDLQVNALDTLGQTALHRAALAGHLQTCRLLLGYGADASLVSLQGFTAAQMGNEAVQQILNGRPPLCVGG